ncbi:MAG: tetratricopeptide repeat protein [Pirellulales bacterium]|nr:tetratricopeptide repeat protein [Pirellulales bacterium]
MNSRALICIGYLLLQAGAARGEGDTLADARKALMAGRYAEAAELFAPPAKERPEAALGLSRCYSQRGKGKEALKALRQPGSHPLLLAELARLAFERGDYAAARSQAEEAVKKEPDQPLARWILAETDRAAGRYDEAERGYRRLIRYYNQHDVRDPEALRWIGRAAAQSARWNRQAEQFQFLVGELYPGMVELQADYWPAWYEMGLLFLEKHNPAEAMKAFGEAEKINPMSAEVHAALARCRLEERDYPRANAELTRALEINPRLLDAWLVKADLAWGSLEPDETREIVEKHLLPLHPNDPEMLGRLAACYLLLDGLRTEDTDSRFAKLLEKVLARNPRPGEFYFTLAMQLKGHNRQPAAEKYLREAARAMPKLPGPRAQRGLLLMAMDRVEEAKPLLKDAFAADPFDVRLHNSLNLLEVLERMPLRETEHCRLRTAEEDVQLAEAAVEELEKIYPELCQRFGYTPPRKAPVDIFRETDGQTGHAWFSTRVSGLPFVGTVAASTGRLVAMVSPGEPDLAHRFNWVRVLRHELTHVITLQQTHFNIPHWYTEGLAVWSEETPRPAVWNRLLIEHVPEGDLFNLRTIDSGFTRAKSSRRWNLAYCQAELYVDYMRQLGGEASLRRMLNEYATGRTTTEAIDRTFGRSEEEFERGYLDFMKNTTAELRRLDWPEKRELNDLREAVQKDPRSAAAAAHLAFYYVERGAWPEAEQWAGKAQQLQPRQPLAAYVLARLWVKAGQPGKAVEILEKDLDPAAPQPNALELLADLKRNAKDYAAAARWYVLGERLDAVNPLWTHSLVRLYQESGESEKLEAALSRLAEADRDELDARLKLAELALKRKDVAAAKKWAAETLEIDVENAPARRVLAEGQAKRHNNKE